MSAAYFIAYQREAHRQVEQQYVEKARSIVLTAESAREEAGRMWDQGIFTTAQIRQWAAAGERDKIIASVPVVTAWRAAMGKAKEGGYSFRVPKFSPRNQANQPDEVEARVLKMFEAGGATEHYEVDRQKNVLRYFRPIRLTQECLACHGDPRQSKTLWGRDDGRDPTGGPMEGWKVGEVHGAFEIVQSLDEADARLASTIRSGVILMAGLIVVGGLVFLFGVPALINRDVVRPVAKMVQSLSLGASQVVSTAEQVAASAQSLSRGATEQAASLEETSASMEEMASMTRKNAENAQQVATLVTGVAGQVDDSNAALAGMVSSMSAITESSGKVAKIIKTIDEIAFQTNILALNAAVEAARAGDAGMGFAVVADEVRNLAQRSAQAARDTAGLIEESIERSQEGATRVHQVAAAIGSITGTVSQVKEIAQEVREASAQQARGIEQVAQAIQQMEKVTQNAAATAEQSAAASEELNAQAAASIAVVGELGAMVGLVPEAAIVAGRRASVVQGRTPSVPARTVDHQEELMDDTPATGTYGRF
ncbi:MAG TPA: methyl-accepting chemotaxis protein [Vicinamibacterales bacterium]|nr:methyl-accepting chemotaxis protein [Vicinamibacterales bacterium]